jgi:LemA protein
MLELIVIIVVVAVVILGIWLAFNGLIRRRNRTQEAWSQIDVELKRRHDLVPKGLQ